MAAGEVVAARIYRGGRRLGAAAERGVRVLALDVCQRHPREAQQATVDELKAWAGPA